MLSGVMYVRASSETCSLTWRKSQEKFMKFHLSQLIEEKNGYLTMLKMKLTGLNCTDKYINVFSRIFI